MKRRVLEREDVQIEPEKMSRNYLSGGCMGEVGSCIGSEKSMRRESEGCVLIFYCCITNCHKFSSLN